MRRYLQQFRKKCKYFFKHYINGVKGAVSLFLILTFTPLLAFALLMVESSRYQNAFSLMQELIDSAAFSTLGDFDNYLDARFGLLSIDQKTPVPDAFHRYITDNQQLMGSAVNIRSAEAEGEHPLSDKSVLKQQIFECSEYSVPGEMVHKSLKLDKLFEALTQNKFNKIQKYAETAKKGVSIADKMTQIIDYTIKLVDAAWNYDNAKTAYLNAYQPFEDAVDDAAQAIKDKKQEIKDKKEEAEKNKDSDDEDSGDASEQDPYQDPVVRSKIRTAKEKAQDYSKKADDLAKLENQLGKAVRKVFTKIDDLPEEYADVKGLFHSLQNGSGSSGDINLPAPGTEAEGDDGTTGATESMQMNAFFKKLLLKIYKAFKKNLTESFENQYREESRALTEQSNKLDKFAKACDVRLGYYYSGQDPLVDEQLLDENWKRNRTQNRFGKITPKSFGENFGAALESLHNDLNKDAEGDEKSKNFFDTVFPIAQDLMKLSFLYDAKLNSQVSASVMFSNTPMQKSAIRGVESIQSMLKAAQDFADGANNGDIFKLISAVGNVLTSVFKFINSIIDWVAEVVGSLASKAAGILSCLGGGTVGNGTESLLLSGYAVYNMPNRITVRTDRNLFGYEFKKIPRMIPADIGSGANLMGSVSAIDGISTDFGSDEMFKGAIGEYILTGIPSEMGAQAATFMDMVYLRMVLNAIPVFSDVGIRALSALGFFGAVLKVMALILESFLDVLLLVNGGKVPFVKKDIWVSADGFMRFINAFRSLKIFDDAKGIGNTVISALTKGKSKLPPGKKNVNYLDELNKTDYTDTLLILMIGSVSDENIVSRVQNVVNMEAKVYHKEDSDFTLYHAYTHVKSTVDYDLMTFYHADGLSKSFAKQTVSDLGY